MQPVLSHWWMWTFRICCFCSRHIVRQLVWLFGFVFVFMQAARPKTAWAQVSLSSEHYLSCHNTECCPMRLLPSSRQTAECCYQGRNAGVRVFMNTGHGRKLALNVHVEIWSVNILYPVCVCIQWLRRLLALWGTSLQPLVWWRRTNSQLTWTYVSTSLVVFYSQRLCLKSRK